MKTAIFLGAGASASEGAPTQNNLFRDFFKTIREEENIISSEMERELATFFYLMFDIDVDHNDLDNIQFPTFEEALGVLDLADSRNESFRNFSNLNVASNSGRLMRLRLYLILLMAQIIHKKLQISGEIHIRLIENLLNKDKLKDVLFISSNYDILIDNALLNEKFNSYPDYGVEFKEIEDGDRYIKTNANKVKLFKIHGSLNWLYCPTCNYLKLTPYKKGVINLIHDINQAYCKDCETIYSPLIVPPTFYKDLSNVFLSIVWNQTENYLLNVEKVIFCGYSFQDADIHIKYLLKRIQKNRDENLKISFIVINNHEGKSRESASEEKNRYIRFLGRSVEYTDYSFDNFAKNPEKFV